MIGRLLAPALMIALAACASDGPREHGGRGRHGPGDPGGPARTRLFISPSGEPFRGENGLGDWLTRADANHDGAVSLAEFRADAQRFFKVLDVNGDGVVDGFEMQAYERDVVPEIGVVSFDEGPQGERSSLGGGRHGGGRGRAGGVGGATGDRAEPLDRLQDTRVPAAGREGAARFSLINEPEPVAAADADLDGKVTLAEWMAITDRRFAKLDHARSGRLTHDNLMRLQPKPAPAPRPR